MAPTRVCEYFHAIKAHKYMGTSDSGANVS